MSSWSIGAESSECDVTRAKGEINSIYFIETKCSKIHVFVKFMSIHTGMIVLLYSHTALRMYLGHLGKDFFLALRLTIILNPCYVVSGDIENIGER